jgi:hypothetical protein
MKIAINFYHYHFSVYKFHVICQSVVCTVVVVSYHIVLVTIYTVKNIIADFPKQINFQSRYPTEINEMKTN